jgi:hypothetical protein
MIPGGRSREAGGEREGSKSQLAKFLRRKGEKIKNDTRAVKGEVWRKGAQSEKYTWALGW